MMEEGADVVQPLGEAKQSMAGMYYVPVWRCHVDALRKALDELDALYPEYGCWYYVPDDQRLYFSFDPLVFSKKAACLSRAEPLTLEAWHAIDFLSFMVLESPILDRFYSLCGLLLLLHGTPCIYTLQRVGSAGHEKVLVVMLWATNNTTFPVRCSLALHAEDEYLTEYNALSYFRMGALGTAIQRWHPQHRLKLFVGGLNNGLPYRPLFLKEEEYFTHRVDGAAVRNYVHAVLQSEAEEGDILDELVSAEEYRMIQPHVNEKEELRYYVHLTEEASRHDPLEHLNVNLRKPVAPIPIPQKPTVFYTREQCKPPVRDPGMWYRVRDATIETRLQVELGSFAPRRALEPVVRAPAVVQVASTVSEGKTLQPPVTPTGVCCIVQDDREKHEELGPIFVEMQLGSPNAPLAVGPTSERRSPTASKRLRDGPDDASMVCEVNDGDTAVPKTRATRHVHFADDTPYDGESDDDDYQRVHDEPVPVETRKVRHVHFAEDAPYDAESDDEGCEVLHAKSQPMAIPGKGASVFPVHYATGKRSRGVVRHGRLPSGACTVDFESY